jgi:hypothetical protein
MTDPKDSNSDRAAWVAPEIRELSVDETHGTPPLGTDGGPYPESQS